MDKNNFLDISESALQKMFGTEFRKIFEEFEPLPFFEDDWERKRSAEKKPVMGTKPGYLSYDNATETFVLNKNPPQQGPSTKVYVESIIELDKRLHHCCWAVIDKDDWQKKNHGIFAEEEVARNQMRGAGVPNLKVVLVEKY